MHEKMTTEEKIDYIFITLKKQESRVLRANVFKWGFRLFILGYIYYFIIIGIPKMIENIVPNMPSIGSESINIDTLRDSITNIF